MTENGSGGEDFPRHVRVKTRLTGAKVNAYWKRLGMAQKTWLENYTLPERYELVLSDLLNKLDEAEGILDELEELEP
jgi:hypothetical protein